jgi:hydrogenase nickel incorporation protein HypA/HybF
MHEMAMSESLVEIVEEECRKHGFAKVRIVRVELGVLGHVEADALRFCFDAVTRGTVAEGARLDIVPVAGAGFCLDCGETVPLSERFGACPSCGAYHVQMTAGDDLRVTELEVD